VRSRDPRSGGDDSVGYFIQPTIIADVKPGARIEQEEIFGPVISILRVKDVDEAIAIENANPYGNACSVFTSSGALAEKIIALSDSRSTITTTKKFRDDDPMQRRPDITLAKELLGWQPKVDFTQGLQKTIAYFKTVV